jgi:hypothetical protein
MLGGLAMQFRIGSRDPITGLYNVIYPDGSSTPNGIKIYNAAHRIGDPVNATRRSDGMIILDNPVAADPSSLSVSAAGNQAGYLNGQVFNGEDEAAILDVFIAKFRPLDLGTGKTFALYCSNVSRSSEISIGVGTPNLVRVVTPPDLIQLDTIPAVYAEIYTNSRHPVFQARDSIAGANSIQYVQIDTATARKICAAQSCRYLIISAQAALSRSLDNIESSSLVEATFSIQVDRYLPAQLPYVAAEYDFPQVLGARQPIGWTDWQWFNSFDFDLPSGATARYYFNAAFIQIDTQTREITILNPIGDNTFGFNFVNRSPEIHYF